MIDAALQIPVKPTPFRPSFKDLSGFGITAHMPYYDSKEKETYGVLKLQKRASNETFWVDLRAYLTNNS